MKLRKAEVCRSGKVRYRDEQAALIGLARCQVENSFDTPARQHNPRREKRAYLCFCGGWHLTSRDSFDGSGVTLE